VRAVDDGLSRNATAKRFDVSVSTVVKLMQQWQATGSYLPKQIGGYRKPVLADHADRVVRLVAEKPDRTIAELQQRLAAEDIKVGPSAITRFLARLGYSYKKNGSRQRTGSAGR
jgi:putative transposase